MSFQDTERWQSPPDEADLYQLNYSDELLDSFTARLERSTSHASTASFIMMGDLVIEIGKVGGKPGTLDSELCRCEYLGEVPDLDWAFRRENIVGKVHVIDSIIQQYDLEGNRELVEVRNQIHAWMVEISLRYRMLSESLEETSGAELDTSRGEKQ